MEKVTGVQPTGCCEIFDPEPWDEQVITWNKRLFVKENVFCIFHIPLNIGMKINKSMKKINKAKIQCNESFFIAEDVSSWKEILYIPVTKIVPNCVMEEISGTFLSKVFEGEYRDLSIWMELMKEYVIEQGKQLQKIYIGYTTCPKCAKVYGKNYVILFAKVG